MNSVDNMKQDNEKRETRDVGF